MYLVDNLLCSIVKTQIIHSSLNGPVLYIVIQLWISRRYLFTQSQRWTCCKGRCRGKWQRCQWQQTCWINHKENLNERQMIVFVIDSLYLSFTIGYLPHYLNISLIVIIICLNCNIVLVFRQLFSTWICRYLCMQMNNQLDLANLWHLKKYAYHYHLEKIWHCQVLCAYARHFAAWRHCADNTPVEQCSAW